MHSEGLQSPDQLWSAPSGTQQTWWFWWCSNTSAALNRKMGFILWWLFSLALRTVHCTSQGEYFPFFDISYRWKKVQNITSLRCCSFFTPFSSQVLWALWQQWSSLLGCLEGSCWLWFCLSVLQYLVFSLALSKCTACTLLITCLRLECGNQDTSCIFLLDLSSSPGRYPHLPVEPVLLAHLL